MRQTLIESCLILFASAMFLSFLSQSVLAADVPAVDPGSSASILVAGAFVVLAVAAIAFWIIRRKRKADD